MGAGHGHTLYYHEHSSLHRLSPQCKLAAAFLFVLAVVATPREEVWAYVVYALLVGGVARLGRIPLGYLARRLMLEAPFVAFALALPFIARGEAVQVGFLSLSSEGMWAAWNILAKATLGLATTLVLAATTDLPDLLRGLERLRIPRAFTAVAGFMFRYADVIAGEMRRMHVARQSRGYDGRWLWQARVVAHSAGALFVRSYERGERVHLAMVARGYTGALPVLDEAAASPQQWAWSLGFAMTGAVVAVVAWALHG